MLLRWGLHVAASEGRVPLGAFTPTDCCLKRGVPVWYRIPALCTPSIPALGTYLLYILLVDKSLLALRSTFHANKERRGVWGSSARKCTAMVVVSKPQVRGRASPLPLLLALGTR